MANVESVTLTSKEFGHVVLMAHNKHPLSDAEWEAGYLAAIRRVKEVAGPNNDSNLVFAEGTGPNATQRATGNAIFGEQKDYQFKVAVVTDAFMVRGAVTALSWFNPLIRAFKPSDWRRAAAHVRFEEKHLPLVQKALLELQSKIADVQVLNGVIAGFNR